MPRRLTILAGHCVTAPSNDRLPKDMKIAGEKLERMLRWLGKRYELTSVGDGVAKIASDGGRSLVALSMDDGYKDNRTHLLPLLAKLGVPATVYLEGRPLEERRVNWSHKFFWILDRVGPKELVKSFGARCEDRASVAALEALQADGRANRVPPEAGPEVRQPARGAEPSDRRDLRRARRGRAGAVRRALHDLGGRPRARGLRARARRPHEEPRDPVASRRVGCGAGGARGTGGDRPAPRPREPELRVPVR
jgi:hypothetical protein